MLSGGVSGAPDQLRRGRGLARLSRVEADAFWDKPHNQGLYWFAPHGFCRVAQAVGLFVSDRHVAEDGWTVVLVGRAGSAGVWVRGVVAAALFLSLWVPVLYLAGLVGVVLGYLAFLVLIGRGLPGQWRARGARARLRALRPAGARLVHSLARGAGSRPGAGRDLMLELQGVADARGWTLVLEAANERLAVYYEGLGWERLGSETLPSGEELTAMVRRPARRVEEAV